MTRFVFNWDWGRIGMGGLGLVVVTLLLVGCGDGQTSTPTANPPTVTVSADTMTIARVLRTDKRFSTLVAALDSTNLDSTLSSDGSFTLFAPPNSAFDELPEGTMDVLLTERIDRLRAILAHHVVGRRVMAAELARPQSVRTLRGDSLRGRRDTTLHVGPAQLLEEDVEVDNGVIHVIDRVLPPPSSGTE